MARQAQTPVVPAQPDTTPMDIPDVPGTGESWVPGDMFTVRHWGGFTGPETITTHTVGWAGGHLVTDTHGVLYDTHHVERI